MRFLTLSLLVYIIGLTFYKVLEISSEVTTCSEATSFLEETKFLEWIVFLVMIVSLTEVTCIEFVGIGSIYIRDDSIGTVSIKIAAFASIRGAGVRTTD